MKVVRTILIAAATCSPAKLLACAACYGANIDAPMAEGMNWAIFTLGAVITTVLGAFLTFLIYAIRKSEALEAAQNAPATAATGPVKPALAESLAAGPLLETQTLIEEPT